MASPRRTPRAQARWPAPAGGSRAAGEQSAHGGFLGRRNRKDQPIQGEDVMACRRCLLRAFGLRSARARGADAAFAATRRREFRWPRGPGPRAPEGRRSPEVLRGGVADADGGICLFQRLTALLHPAVQFRQERVADGASDSAIAASRCRQGPRKQAGCPAPGGFRRAIWNRTRGFESPARG